MECELLQSVSDLTPPSVLRCQYFCYDAKKSWELEKDWCLCKDCARCRGLRVHFAQLWFAVFRLLKFDKEMESTRDLSLNARKYLVSEARRDCCGFQKKERNSCTAS